MKKLPLLILILIISFTSTISAVNKSRDIFFVLQNKVSFKTNLQGIYDPKKYDLVLLINKEMLKHLTNEQKKVFHKIIVVKDFNYEKLKNIIEGFSIDSKNSRIHIITNDEYSLKLAGLLRDYFNTGEPGFSVLEPFLDKLVMKNKLFDNLNIRVPKYIVFNSKKYLENPKHYTKYITKNIPFPIFAKPTNDAGATSIQKIENKIELEQWLLENKNKQNFELDEFIEGELYHVDNLIQNNQIIFEQVSKYSASPFEFLNGKASGSIALSTEYDNDDIIKITNFNRLVLSAMYPVPNGAVHLEVFKKKDGTLVFLEIAARAPGTSSSNISRMYSKYLGINMEEAHFNLQMGLPCDNNCKVNKGSYTAWMTFPTKNCTIEKIVKPKIVSKSTITYKIKPGDCTKNSVSLKETAMSMLFWGNDYKTVTKDFNYLKDFEPYVCSKH